MYYLKHELTETICIKWPKIFGFVFMEKAEESINQSFHKNTECLVQEALSTSKNLQ